MESTLRRALARDEALLRQKDAFIQQQKILSKESDHRFLNGVQMVVSLLSLQGRASTNAEVASKLTAAADRIAAIARIRRDLHNFDGLQFIPLKHYLEDLCREFSATMLSSKEGQSASSLSKGLRLNCRLQ